ncbi:hypothetical protein ACIO1C_06735 [Streptomyces sp. NPDC087420]|uniref:hypothetical protein n=1 Tax=Streptomyces sp. NPDC087420 TaxID=3365785 RepID=UPI003834B7AF
MASPGSGSSESNEESYLIKKFKEYSERELVKKTELTALKSEMNGANLAANFLGGELTGVKLEYTFFDPVGRYLEKKAEKNARDAGVHPTQLKLAADGARAAAGRAQEAAGSADRKAQEAYTQVRNLRRALGEQVGLVRTDIRGVRRTADEAIRLARSGRSGQARANQNTAAETSQIRRDLAALRTTIDALTTATG